MVEWLTGSPIAHRGLHDASGGVPENSMASFRRAIQRGVPFELDVQQLADGTLVVQHDVDLKLSSGALVPIGDARREHLKQAAPLSNGEPLPLLDQVLEANGTVPMVIDVRRYAWSRDGQLERTIMASLKDYPGPYALQSFDPTAVWRFAREGYRPVGQATGDLPSVGRPMAAIGRAMVTNFVTRPDFMSHQLDRLPTRWATWWRSRGIPVLAYTARTPDAAEECARVADNYFFAGFLPRVYQER